MGVKDNAGIAFSDVDVDSEFRGVVLLLLGVEMHLVIGDVSVRIGGVVLIG